MIRFATATRDSRSIKGILQRVRVIEDAGFDTAGFADTQTLHPDPFVAMTAAAMAGSKLRLMTNLSNPVTRHPSIVATAIGGIQEVAEGGVIFAFGAGDTSLLNIGRESARLADVRAFGEALRSLQDRGEARYGAGTIRYDTRPPRVPIHFGAHGPKSLTLAGELGDGVWIGAGVDQATVADALGHIRAGMARGGRTAIPEIGCYVRCWIGDPEEGERAMAASLAAVGHYALSRAPAGKGVPPAVLPSIEVLGRRYDSISHALGGEENPNGKLVRELGLLPYLAGRFALLGTPAAIAARLRGLAALGVTSFFMQFRGDVDEQLGRFGREVIPALR